MNKRKLSTVGLSVLIIVVLVIWMATGDVRQSRDTMPESQPEVTGELPRVQIQLLQAQLYQPFVRLQGQLMPWRSVAVSARVPATVESIKVEQGQQVRKGDVLARLSEDGRGTVVERWEARVRKLESDLAAARRLRSDNLASQSEILSLESDLAAARAELRTAKLALEHLLPAAPFDGIINARHVETGDLVQIGSPLFEVVQVERLKGLAQVPQQSVAGLVEGQPVSVDLLDGTSLEGKVNFIASAADPATRSFPVEIIVQNPDRRRVAGGTATLRIALPEVRAHFISPAYLSLGDDGRPGVTHVNDNDRVEFAHVRLLSVTTEGAWVAGLPDELRLLTRGAGFVAVGQKVEPVPAADDRG
ncbi:efflux RND transporter periplasmic adaptor subunit [Marinobacter sp.]|jgi:multidrug efflux system membrane fusion protein|uniref:efflux RND transporter periplasmic adaptor subunit n=1 Tax=Marinobacter sp. TaxID=50741 RepID=UPI00198BF4D3|nr:efflux RND transporter periplasmic adaptor subunit [Marinobacter sp.]MBC7193462.1 efflux RND transporter periplasmic adaptor subunit [Marinobacter sp.]